MATHHPDVETFQLRRPRYFMEQLLTKEIFEGEQDYHRNKRWLINRALLGEGVVLGLELTADEADAAEPEDDCGQQNVNRGRRLHLSPGLALDRHGHEIVVDRSVTISATQLLHVDELDDGDYTLRIHYAERDFPSQTEADCEPCWHEPAWVLEHHRLSLRDDDPPQPCACPDLEDGKSLDACGYVQARQLLRDGSVASVPHLAHAVCPPSKLARSGTGWRYAATAGVALARVKLTKERIQPANEREDGDGQLSWHLDLVEAGDRRPIVYRNQQLFEILSECHIERPHVCRLAWVDDPAEACPELSWERFRTLCNRDGDPGFVVHLNRPARAATLHQGSVMLNAVIQERRTDYWETRRIPLQRIEALNRVGDLATSFLLVPHEDWLTAEVNGTRSTLFDGAMIELLLRGAMIRDQDGGMLDARPLDLPKDPPAHARPGGDFVHVVRILPRSDVLAGTTPDDSSPYNQFADGDDA